MGRGARRRRPRPETTKTRPGGGKEAPTRPPHKTHARAAAPTGTLVIGNRRLIEMVRGVGPCADLVGQKRPAGAGRHDEVGGGTIGRAMFFARLLLARLASGEFLPKLCFGQLPGPYHCHVGIPL